MTAARKDGSVRIKLTISREEHPAMFEALASIRNPRRRTGRLKELVVFVARSTHFQVLYPMQRSLASSRAASFTPSSSVAG